MSKCKNSEFRLLAYSGAAKVLPCRTFDLKFGENRLGRSRKSDITLPTTFCSRTQCSIMVDSDSQLSIVDLSQNGTFVNSVRLNKFQSYGIKENDIVTVGNPKSSSWAVDIKNAFTYIVHRDKVQSVECIDIESETETGTENDANGSEMVQQKPSVEIKQMVTEEPENQDDSTSRNSSTNSVLDEVILQVHTEPMRPNPFAARFRAKWKHKQIKLENMESVQ